MNNAPASTTAALAAQIRAAEEAMRPERGEPQPAVNGRWASVSRQTLHEWFADMPPQMLLTDLVRHAGEDHAGYVFWIGRACWPYAPALVGRANASTSLLRRSVCIDIPLQQTAARAWAIDLVLRSPATLAVVADGRQFNVAQSRRLQLAAEAGVAMAMLWRQERELSTRSVAHHRWRVTPAPTTERRPRWRIDMLRCKGSAGFAPLMNQHTNQRRDAGGQDAHHHHTDGEGPPHRQAESAGVFVVEYDDAQGVVPVSPKLADRPPAPAIPQTA